MFLLFNFFSGGIHVNLGAIRQKAGNQPAVEIVNATKLLRTFI